MEDLIQTYILKEEKLQRRSSLDDMLSESAYVKLGWILGHKSFITIAKIKKNVGKYIRESIIELDLNKIYRILYKYF